MTHAGRGATHNGGNLSNRLQDPAQFVSQLNSIANISIAKGVGGTEGNMGETIKHNLIPINAAS